MKIAFEIYQIYPLLWLMEVLTFCAWSLFTVFIKNLANFYTLFYFFEGTAFVMKMFLFILIFWGFFMNQTLVLLCDNFFHYSLYVYFTAWYLSDRTIISIYVSHYLTWNCLLNSDDFPGFAQHHHWFLFCFDFHSSAEQFYDRKKQERGKNHKSTYNAMPNDGSSIKIIYQSHGD